MSDTAMLVVDMLNSYQHPDAELLIPNVAEIVEPLADLVRPIVPTEGSRQVTKVRHSVFYSTALEYLLGRLGTKRLILTGQVTEQCILYSALDAYLRHFPVVVPTDAVAHIDAELGAAALKMMQANMDAALKSAAECLD